MATKKKSEKKIVGWRPSRGDINFTELGLRAPIGAAQIIQDAAVHEAERMGIARASRNNFCLRACILAAEKELEIKNVDRHA